MSAFVFTEKKYHVINEYIVNKGLSFYFDYSEGNFIIDIGYDTTNIESKIKLELPLVTVIPKCKMYIDFNGKECLAVIKFEYGGIDVSVSDLSEMIEAEDKKMLRNKVFEEDIINFIRQLGFVYSVNGYYRLNNLDDFSEKVNFLFEKGIKVYSKNKKNVYPILSKNISISYDIDWFSVKVMANTKHGFIDVSDKINLNSSYVEIDGETFLLPDILKTKKLHKDIKGLKIQKNDYIDALYMASQTSEKKIININKFFSKNKNIIIPDNIGKVLRSYQREGLIWLEQMYQSNLGACLADDMGLGKTVQAISLLRLHSDIKSKYPKLIIAPKSLIYNWKNEIEKFAPELCVVIYHGDKRKKLYNKININTVILSTFGTVLNDIETLRTFKFDIVIIDEIQYIKNNKSKTFKAISCLNRNMTVGLSGTPFENNIIELWSIMNILNREIFKDESKFINFSETEQFEKLNKMITPFILRREKKDVLKELPEKKEIVVKCDMEESQYQLYNSLRLKILSEIKRMPSRFEIKSSADILKGLLLLRQAACHPLLLSPEINSNNCNTSAKFELLKNKISSLVSAKEKVIVFSQFTSMLKITENWLIKEKIPYYYLDGKTNNRQDVINSFENSKCSVFLISLKAGGVGLNLTSCHYVIIYDPWWNPATEKQAADRVYRIGQYNDVFVYKLITNNTIEEKIQQLQQKKNVISDSIFKNLNNIGDLSIDEIIDLLI